MSDFWIVHLTTQNILNAGEGRTDPASAIAVAVIVVVAFIVAWLDVRYGS